MVTTDTYGYVVLDNLGPNGWDLRIRTGQTVHHVQFSNANLADDQSPRDYAVAEIAKVGWSVAGNGSWQMGAWSGPQADTSWARIEPARKENDVPDLEGLIEDLARGLCADWYRTDVNGLADDAEVNAFWVKPYPSRAFPDPEMMHRSFRNKARSMVSERG